MFPVDPDHYLRVMFTAMGKASADFAVALIDYVSRLELCDREFAEEILMRLLAVSKTKAARLLQRAEDLTGRPVVLRALAEGRVDEGKALMIVDLLSTLSAVHAAIAEEDFLAFAETHDYTATRRHAVRFIDKLDPKAAERRHKEKRKARLVEKIPQDDGMCLLRMFFPALQASLIYDRIDRIARALPKDHRTLDQKRADVTMDVLMGKETGAPQGQVTVYLTMPMGSFLGLSDEPAILHGYGPLPAKIARDVAANGIWKRILTDPVTGIAEDVTTYRPSAKQRELIHVRYPTCTAIGCNRPAHRCDLDHCCPFDGTNTTVDNLRPKCRRHHRMKHESNWKCENLPDGRHVWTTPNGKTAETEAEPIAEPAPF
ncbi:HNH endonuclease [Allokutzneria sp. A3M-2-11 16]|uniref:HNH endonuclease signature motif containing protein n=1 Tax=Allokutzneria sp. A3M-2-11 16 TaxID=2962043 RepID=UPI0020B74497|nr:HNH endonuclease signature motif containing protein [Allokutzneria sp. A3M-2-11 16]MCP3803099.1 HNH endonuclease [Allokutzneria sp. A3M-2-11 16]